MAVSDLNNKSDVISAERAMINLFSAWAGDEVNVFKLLWNSNKTDWASLARGLGNSVQNDS